MGPLLLCSCAFCKAKDCELICRRGTCFISIISHCTAWLHLELLVLYTVLAELRYCIGNKSNCIGRPVILSLDKSHMALSAFIWPIILPIRENCKGDNICVWLKTRLFSLLSQARWEKALETLWHPLRH